MDDPAFVIATVSLLLTFFNMYDARRRDTLYANVTALSEIESTLGTMENGLRLRGISKQELDACGITEEEFSYLLANFLAGWMYSESLDKWKWWPYKPKHYRYKLLQSETTQCAWPLIRRLLDDCRYVKRIDKTIEVIRSKGHTVKVSASETCRAEPKKQCASNESTQTNA